MDYAISNHRSFKHIYKVQGRLKIRLQLVLDLMHGVNRLHFKSLRIKSQFNTYLVSTSAFICGRARLSWRYSQVLSTKESTPMEKSPYPSLQLMSRPNHKTHSMILAWEIQKATKVPIVFINSLLWGCDAMCKSAPSGRSELWCKQSLCNHDACMQSVIAWLVAASLVSMQSNILMI